MHHHNRQRCLSRPRRYGCCVPRIHGCCCRAHTDRPRAFASLAKEALLVQVEQHVRRGSSPPISPESLGLSAPMLAGSAVTSRLCNGRCARLSRRAAIRPRLSPRVVGRGVQPNRRTEATPLARDLPRNVQLRAGAGVRAAEQDLLRQQLEAHQLEVLDAVPLDDVAPRRSVHAAPRGTPHRDRTRGTRRRAQNRAPA